MWYVRKSKVGRKEVLGGREQTAVLNIVIFEKVRFEQRCKRNEGVSQADTWRACIPGRGSRQSKGSTLGLGLTCPIRSHHVGLL